MRFAIITHVPHGSSKNHYFAYAPYVREMNIWIQFADEVEIIAPSGLTKKNAIDLDYVHENIELSSIKSMDLLGFKAMLLSFLNTPKTLYKIFQAMRKADHIHLRCPGNIGLLGCFVQILFPKKNKTAKYAGNWDPNARQPFTYRLQKWILNNTFLTRNIKVLVYGQWHGASKNIEPFFTATYRETDKKKIETRSLNDTINFLFVGTLSPGKRPLYALQLIEKLVEKGIKVSLDLFGEGSERIMLEKYCVSKNLGGIVHFHGNQREVIVRKAYQQSHCLLLPSKSEGWPKVVAEAMFWGVLPLASNVSCISFMIGAGSRGIILTMDLDLDVAQIVKILKDQPQYQQKVLESVSWSQKYTLDLFENQIKAFMQK